MNDGERGVAVISIVFSGLVLMMFLLALVDGQREGCSASGPIYSLDRHSSWRLMWNFSRCVARLQDGSRLDLPPGLCRTLTVDEEIHVDLGCATRGVRQVSDGGETLYAFPNLLDWALFASLTVLFIASLMRSVIAYLLSFVVAAVILQRITFAYYFAGWFL